MRNLNETNVDVDDRSTAIFVVKLLWLLILMIAGLSLNVSLLILIKIKSDLRKPSHLLLSSIAASNVICCVLVLPLIIIKEIQPNFHLIGPVCEGHGNIIQLWSISNIYSIMFYCHDTSKSIRDPMPYRVASNRRTAWSIAFLWVLAVTASWLPVFGFAAYKASPAHGICDRNWYDAPNKNIIVTSITFWLPFLLIIFFNLRIIMSAHSSLNYVKSLHEITRLRELQIRRRSLYKIVKMSLFVVSIISLSWALHLIIIYISAFHQSNVILKQTLTFTFYASFLPILAYPYLFGVRNETVGRKLKIMLLKTRCCCSDVNKITPAVEIDENDYTENVSRRNSRTESLQGGELKKFSLQSTSLFAFIKQRRDSTGSTMLTPVDM